MADTVSVTQVDRNDAADYGKAMQTLSGRERDSILRGKWDSSAPVQWFARRRLASTQPAPAFPREEVRAGALEEAATVCDGLAECWKGKERASAYELAADRIRALLQGKQP